MKSLYEEILEIPARAEECYKQNKKLGITLPQNVQYLGMGSSYFAPLILKFAGAKIDVNLASEYYYYLAHNKEKLGVLVSQSGESSEVILCAKNFDETIAITNNNDSKLANLAKKTWQIYSGKENYSSTKSFINTLITLYLGLGFEVAPAIETLKNNFPNFENIAQKHAEKIIKYLSANPGGGLYILGSGPNYGTALEGALTLSETTKMPWIGMELASFDHGPKETANNSVIIILNAFGKDKERIQTLVGLLHNKSNALIIEIEEKEINEKISPIIFAPQIMFLMDALAKIKNIGETFVIGEKITRSSIEQ